MITRTFDAATGIVSVIGEGVWSFSDIEHHYAALREMIAGLRAEGMPIRVLSDVSRGQRQATWVEDYILLQMEQTFLPGDRLALLAGNEADKAYLHSRAGQPEIASFTSRLAAEQWLTASDASAGVT